MKLTVVGGSIPSAATNDRIRKLKYHTYMEHMLSFASFFIGSLIGAWGCNRWKFSTSSKSSRLKLYSYCPVSYGQASFYVVSDSEENAFANVDKHVKEVHVKNGVLMYEAKGWGTDGYILEVSEIGQVVSDND